MSQQEFVKNNDKPSADSVLWEFADDWKTSQQTGLSYASMPGVERKDEGLYEGLRSVIKSKKIEDIEYQSYYFVPTLFPNKDKSQKNPHTVSNWHVFVYDNVADARKKAESQNRFIKWDMVPEATAVTAPKPKVTITPPTITGTTEPVKKLSEPRPDTKSAEYIQSVQAPLLSSQQSIQTFTDLQVVDTTEAKALEQKGYNFIPSTLLSNNHWKEDVYDNDSGEIVGSRHLFVVGRIINAKIADV